MLSFRDMRSLLTDKRVALLALDDDGDMASANYWDKAIDYYPFWHGNSYILPLSARLDMMPDIFTAVWRTIAEIIAARNRDYAIQARFGRQWLRNILLNARYYTETRHPLPRLRSSRAIITGAGPSLDKYLDKIAALLPQFALIATDTSLPLLQSSGITPDVVVSIDCQHIGYRHFINGLSPRVTSALELGSPPAIASRSSSIHFCASRHPLAIYFRQKIGPFPHLSLSAGNVAHTALSYAITRGAREIEIFGVDFCYRGGLPYCKESAIHRHALNLAHRCHPAEGALVAFMFDSKGLYRSEQAPQDYRVGLLDHYNAQLRHHIAQRAGATIRFHPEPPPVQIDTAPLPPDPPLTLPQTIKWRPLLERYRDDLLRMEKAGELERHTASAYRRNSCAARDSHSGEPACDQTRPCPAALVDRNDCPPQRADRRLTMPPGDHRS